MTDRAVAVVVGISRYSDTHAPSLPTSAVDAVRVAFELQQFLVVPDQTYVFVDPDRTNVEATTAYETARATLAAGTHVVESCSHETLDDFWRATLRALPQNLDRDLIFYWCGHGFTDAQAGLPYLLCSDWTDAKATRLVNRTELLASLHSSWYQRFRRQLILIDACARNLPSPIEPASTKSPWSNAIDQACICAAARGRYAHGDAASGRFTAAVLESLKHCRANAIDPFELDTFVGILKPHAEKTANPSTLVRYGRGTGSEEFWFGGIAARQELSDLFGALKLAPQDYLPRYELVVAALAPEPGRGKAGNFDEIIADLWNASGHAGSAHAPHAIVEFVMRLRRVFPDRTASLEAWIGNTAFVRASDLEAVTHALAEEAERRFFLVIELVDSKSAVRTGEIVQLRARLLRFNRSAIPLAGAAATVDGDPEDIAVESATLEATIEAIVSTARSAAAVHDAKLTVEIVTNVFDVDAHRVRLNAGGRVGEEHPVVLRWRDRTQQSKDRREVWLKRATDIRKSAAVGLHPIKVDRMQLKDCAIVFVDQVLAPGSWPKYPDPLPPEWELLTKAVRAGAPFICWPLDTAPGDLNAFKRAIKKWIKSSRPLDQLPATMMAERGDGTVASATNLFWDDPLTTYQLREIRKG